MTMKKLASLVVCLGLMSSALAEETQTLSASVGEGRNPSSLVFSLGGGAGFYGGDYGRLYDSGLVGYGVNLGAMYRVAEIPLYAGLDFALGSWNFAGIPEKVDRSASAIQVLPTIVYDLSIKGLPPKLVPYVGLSAGPNFYVFRQRTVVGNELKVDSRVSVYLEVLIRAGANYRILENLALGGEIKAGILNFSAVVLPVGNLVVTL